MMPQIRTAVFPVAGLGTRFLPATKASPKEMLPIVDKPLIQYAVEEAIEAGIDRLVFVTSSSKRAIEDHFDKNYELESELKGKGKYELLGLVRDLVPSHVSCAYVRQPEPLGLGHAVLCARHLVGNEPFAVILADDLMFGTHRSCLGQMVERYQERRCSLLGVEPVSPTETASYGIVDYAALSERLHRVHAIVEKPQPDVAPSNMAVMGRYILTPRIFELLAQVKPGAGGEIQLTDGIAALLVEQPVLAYQFDGVRYDCGSKLGYLMATVEYALRHPQLQEAFREYLTEFVRTLDVEGEQEQKRLAS